MTMDIEQTSIDGVLIITARKFPDDRGFFAPVFRSADLEAAGITHGWVQENQSLSLRKGTIRGLHFQKSPFAQAKLVRVVRGAVLDVCVDIRPGSATFGQHVSVELTADNMRQVYVPSGFAHGFCTIEDHTEVLYKVSTDWSPSHEAGLLWSDPELAIAWPVSAEDVTIVSRDASWPPLAALYR